MERNDMFLYIVYNKKTQLTKIGITESIERRLGQIEKSCGCKIYNVGSIEIEHALEMEKFLHATFRYKREYGEWFKLDNLDYRFLGNLWCVYFADYYSISYSGDCIEEEMEKRKGVWMFPWRGDNLLDEDIILEIKNSKT